MNVLRFLAEEEVHGEFATDNHYEDDHNDDKPWGVVIGACMVAQMITLSGVILSATVGMYNKSRAKQGKASITNMVHNIIVPSFAAGALLATAVFLLVPESIHLMSGGHGEHGAEEEEGVDEAHRWMRHHRFLQEEEEHHEEDGPRESEISWKFGAAFLGGFLLPAILHTIFPTVHYDLEEKHEQEDELGEGAIETLTSRTAAATDDKKEPDSDEKEEESTNTVTVSEGSPPREKNWGLATSISVGDAFHNFTDGIFIGTAFLLCGSTTGWTLVGATIYHELGQEIADFALLKHHCGFKTWQALALNFCAGMSIILGGIVVLWMDVDNLAQGIILAVSAGVYFFIGGTECVPRALKAAAASKQALLFLGCFVMGAVPIGLVLLNHEHCEAVHHDEGDHQDRL